MFICSVDTLHSHVQGVKHVKKKIAMEAKNDALRNQGLAPETKVVRQVSTLSKLLLAVFEGKHIYNNISIYSLKDYLFNFYSGR